MVELVQNSDGTLERCFLDDNDDDSSMVMKNNGDEKIKWERKRLEPPRKMDKTS